MTIQWTKNGQPCEAPNGYNVADYFPGLDIATATTEQLEAANLGPDAEGIGVHVSIQ